MVLAYLNTISLYNIYDRYKDIIIRKDLDYISKNMGLREIHKWLVIKKGFGIEMILAMHIVQWIG